MNVHVGAEPDLGRGAVLQLCSDFPTQSLYQHFVDHLRDIGERQTVFVPVRKQSLLAFQPPDGGDAVCYRFRHIVRPAHRVFFLAKIRAMYRSLASAGDLGEHAVSHAHTMYSMGALALRLKKEQGIPYVVAVRNTDLNYFMRYRPDLKSVGRKILLEAGQVIFLSPAYRREFIRKLDDDLRSHVEEKAQVLPNGLDSFWLQDAAPAPFSSGGDLRVLYVGDFSANKNVPGLLRAMSLLRSKRPARLTIVGGGGSGSGRIMRLLEGPEGAYTEHLGKIEDRIELRRIYRAHDLLVVPSFKETFGLVYVEALSQGLPVVHSQGQGIDGFFDPGTVAEAVDPRQPAKIAAGIERLSLRREEVRDRCIAEAGEFGWQRIAPIYSDIYEELRRG